MKTEDFDYELPSELIAQTPAIPRDTCRLLVVENQQKSYEHRIFSDIGEYLLPGDLLVVNNTRVLPARLIGKKEGTGGEVEILLLDRISDDYSTWHCLVRPGKRVKPGHRIEFFSDEVRFDLIAEVIDANEGGQRTVRFTSVSSDIDELLHKIGTVPLPPYITQRVKDPEYYQTVYSQKERSAAAPTAGLHFTPELFAKLEEKGVNRCEVELQVGLDTFRTVEVEDPTKHVIHTERIVVEQEAASMINETKRRGGRIVAVGTTSVRAIESAFSEEAGGVVPCEMDTSLFILPGFTFNVADMLITNFHVPRSSLMMLVSAFTTIETIQNAYTVAIQERYRMLSFGDAMLLYKTHQRSDT